MNKCKLIREATFIYQYICTLHAPSFTFSISYLDTSVRRNPIGTVGIIIIRVPPVAGNAIVFVSFIIRVPLVGGNLLFSLVLLLLLGFLR